MSAQSAKIAATETINNAIATIDAQAVPNMYAMHTATCPECGDNAAQLCEDTGIITCIECLYFA